MNGNDTTIMMDGTLAGGTVSLQGATQTIDLMRLGEEDPVRMMFTEGERVVADGHRPFLIDDPHSVWLVEEGKIEIFTIAVNDDGEPEGARSHFFTVEPGRCIFGMNLAEYGMGSGFLAVGRTGTVLWRLPLMKFRGLGSLAITRKTTARIVEAWVRGLSRRLTRDTPRPRAHVAIPSGEEDGITSLKDEVKARSRRGVQWLQIEDGELLYIGMEELYLEPGAFFPLAPETWVEGANEPGVETKVSSCSTLEALSPLKDAHGMWAGLEAFHQVLCQCEFINKRLAMVDEMQRLRGKEAHAEEARHAAWRDLLSVMDDGLLDLQAESQGSEEAFFEAARLVAEATGMPVQMTPDLYEKETHADRLLAVSKASRFRVRKVGLRDEWWRGDQGPILAETLEGAPVALLPTGPQSYECVDTATGTRRPVDAAVAEGIADFGNVFYRPFPDGQLGVWELLRFGARGIFGDLRILVAMGISVGLLGALTPVFTGKIFDSAIPQADRSLLVQFAAALILGAFIRGAFTITQSIAVVRVQGRMDYAIQSALWDRLLDLPADFFREYSAGDLADRASGISKIRGLLSGAGISAILGSFSSVFYVGLMFVYNLELAIAAMILTAIFVGFTTALNLIRLRLQRDQLRLTGVLSGLVLQLISGVSKLRVSGAEDHAFRVWAREFAALRKIEFTLGKLANYVTVFNSGFPVVSSMVVFFVLKQAQEAIVAQGGEGLLSTGEFIAFNAAYLAFLGAMQSLSDASMSLLRAIPIYERLQPILDTEPEIDEGKTHPGRLTGRIELRHVHFRYDKEGPWVLDDVSLTIEPGEMVAFVGGSGSGKSTLMRLLLGFEKPDKGSVYYDEQDLSSLDLREVRQQFGVVLQDSRLMPTDIFRNIVGQWPSLTVDDAWEAAGQAGIARDIHEMPMGMHTYISAGGGGFSGGQKQRLMIARAIVNKPRILFLDEATSALDNRSQATVTESLDKLQATRIVIAHRLSTIVNADRICVLEQGRIQEMGTYEELMALDGLFAESARRQTV